MILTLTRMHAEAGNIRSFIFRPEEPFDWEAGQSLRLEVPGPYGAVERRFTIASAPHTGEVMVTTRKSDSDFKQSLFDLPPGSRVRAYGLEGTFVWRTERRKPVFIAAGVGITPFRAMLADRIHKQLPLTATLIYGGADNNLAFKSTFDAWSLEYPSLTIHYIIGEHITAQHVTRLVPDAVGRHIFLSGPSAMVDDVSAGLLAQGVDEDHLVRDWFTGGLSRDG